MKKFLAVTALSIASTCSAETQVYYQTFESGVRGNEWSGAGAIESTEQLSKLDGPRPPGSSTVGHGKWELRNASNAPTSLTLSNLPSHSLVTLVFGLVTWDDLDPAIDLFTVKVDGRTFFSSPIGGAAGFGAMVAPPANYGHGTAIDYSFSVGLGFFHKSNTLTVEFANPMAGSNSGSFSLDNLSVYLTPAAVVPEPGTLLLAGVGLCAILRRASRRSPTLR